MMSFSQRTDRCLIGLLLLVTATSCKRNGFTPGEFSLDAQNSTTLSSIPSSLVLKARFSQDGTVDIQPLNVRGDWKVSGDKVEIKINEPIELFNALEGRKMEDRSPLNLSWKQNGHDELVWEPQSFAGKQRLILVFSRSPQ